MKKSICLSLMAIALFFDLNAHLEKQKVVRDYFINCYVQTNLQEFYELLDPKVVLMQKIDGSLLVINTNQKVFDFYKREILTFTDPLLSDVYMEEEEDQISLEVSGYYTQFEFEKLKRYFFRDVSKFRIIQNNSGKWVIAEIVSKITSRTIKNIPVQPQEVK